MTKIIRSKTNVTKPVAVKQVKKGAFGLLPFGSLQDELEKIMGSFYSLPAIRHLVPQSFENLILKPAIDVVNDQNSFKVEAELPGLSEKEISVSIGDGMLMIKGEKEISRKDVSKNYIAREIGYGRYERTIALPDRVDIAKAKASFKKGMLWVDIPKRTESLKRMQQVKIDKAA